MEAQEIAMFNEVELSNQRSTEEFLTFYDLRLMTKNLIEPWPAKITGQASPGRVRERERSAGKDCFLKILNFMVLIQRYNALNNMYV